jgi:hypothetical protein
MKTNQINGNLPAGWSIAGEYMKREDGVESWVGKSSGGLDFSKVACILQNYGHDTHAALWQVSNISQEEHAALVAVAESAQHCLSERDCKSPINSDSVLRFALANLAAVREGKAQL